MAITIKDVAKETNLAISTISKYINGGNVREKNRIIIQQAIEKLGYIPNDAARSLRTSKSYLIGIMEGYIHSAHQSVIVGEIEKKLREKGYSLLFAGKDMEDGQAIRFAIENLSGQFRPSVYTFIERKKYSSSSSGGKLDRNGIGLCSDRCCNEFL